VFLLFVFFFLVAFVAFRTLGIWSCVAFCSLAYVSFVFSVSWLVAFVALGNSSTIVKTKSKTSIRTKKGAIISKIRERSNDRLYRNTSLTSDETIRAQHSFASTYILHVHKVHVVNYIHTAYQIQPRTLHMRMGIIVVLSAGGGAPSPPIPFRIFIQIQTCTLLNTLLYMRV
jgi:hypothetical protein